jgi:hypothetical protein
MPCIPREGHILPITLLRNISEKSCKINNRGDESGRGHVEVSPFLLGVLVDVGGVAVVGVVSVLGT